MILGEYQPLTQRYTEVISKGIGMNFVFTDKKII